MSAIVAGVGLLLIAFLPMALFMYALSRALHHRRFILAALIALPMLAAVQKSLVPEASLPALVNNISSIGSLTILGYAVFHRCPRRAARTAHS